MGGMGKKVIPVQERAERAIALAALLMEAARQTETSTDRNQQAFLAGMMNDLIGLPFLIALTDQCFRSNRSARLVDQLSFLIHQMGVPSFLPFYQRLALQVLPTIGKPLAPAIAPLIKRMIRKKTASVILPGEATPLAEHLRRRQSEGVRTNLNHLGEAILGEEEAESRLQIYLEDLAKPEVDYISVKISTLYSQIHLPAWESSLDSLASRLRLLYRAAIAHPRLSFNGKKEPKFVNLDMEESHDVELTVALFQKILDEAEFLNYSAGIVLQSYLPPSFSFQKQLTEWAMQRVAQGGAPIKIRLVKGANLAMEKVDASLHGWPQVPYLSKEEVDAQYKHMLLYGCQKEHAHAVHLGVATHNLFDAAYALLLRAENGVEEEVSFEMLEGMAEPLRRVVQKVAGGMLLYCPVAKKKEFQNAVAYLVRRLDENTAPENFLRHLFDLTPGSTEWERQAQRFREACLAPPPSSVPRRTQDRLNETLLLWPIDHFENVPDTDWSLAPNRRWIKQIVEKWKGKTQAPIPLVIDNQTLYEGRGQGVDPSYPHEIFYLYSQASEEQVNQALNCAKRSEKEWSQTPWQERARLLSRIAEQLYQHRGELIGAMVADTGKTVTEADSEVSEAIDFANYYRFNLEEWHRLPDIEWQAKGTLLVAPPWNFPCSIPAGGILAALATGNCVIFKPATEAILVGWTLVQLFWQAGVSKEVLQFLTCEDDPIGSRLIQDRRLDAVVLTGGTATAKLFLRLRPDLDLIAETGGKNTMVITSLADRDLAIKDLIHSAFSYSGQKCSACSLAILEAEVYDDPHFRRQLRDAAASLPVGSPWDLKTKVNPLIRPPQSTLMRGLTQLEPGEEWLLEPRQDPENSSLWSPGIKLGVTPASFTFQNELFGPVLGLVRTETIDEAFALMNQTIYGLTAGIHTLDEREQQAWFDRIEAGNCYINRTITGAIVERQPFGGCKESSFGKGAKAGGPNYLVAFMQAKQIGWPTEQAEPNEQIKALSKIIQPFLEEEGEWAWAWEFWKASIGSDAFYWQSEFSQRHDRSQIRGQENFQLYRPHPHIVLRGQTGDSPLDLLRIIAAALACEAHLEVSLEESSLFNKWKEGGIDQWIVLKQESNVLFAQRARLREITRVRAISPFPEEVQIALAEGACRLNLGKVVANGRLELLHLLREVSLSRNYHRYGYLDFATRKAKNQYSGSSYSPILKGERE